jgi:RHS repeat-associated protein
MRCIKQESAIAGTNIYNPGVSQKRGSTKKFLGADRLGTMTHEFDSSQSTTLTRDLDAFGNLRGSSGSSTSNFDFAGKHGYLRDSSSQLQQVGHRYYDASIGRFLTKDPAKHERNWYAYCGNNPLKWVDPKGLDWHDPTVVSVSPNFDGYVIAVGEPGPGQDIVSVVIRPGEHSDPPMDVDYIIIVHRDGSRQYVFIPGEIKPGRTTLLHSYRSGLVSRSQLTRGRSSQIS